MQKILFLNIYDYKSQGKYIVYDKKQMIYDIIFEWIFINGKKQEYNKIGKFIFERKNKYWKKWNGIGKKLINNKYYEIIDEKGRVNESNYFGFILWRWIFWRRKKWEEKEYYQKKLLYEIKNGKGEGVLLIDYGDILEYEWNVNILNGEKMETEKILWWKARKI